MSTLSSANVTEVNLVLKERTHMRLCPNMLIFTHNLDNWLISLISDDDSPAAAAAVGSVLVVHVKHRTVQSLCELFDVVSSALQFLHASPYWPRPTQSSIPPGSVNEYQLRLGRQRQVWFIPLADERGVCT